MVVSGDAGILELPGSFVAQLPQCDADFHPEGADRAHGFENRFKLCRSFANTFPRRAHAKACRAVGLRRSGNLHHVVGRHQPLGLDAGRVSRALGAVETVLAAPTGLDAKQGAELDSVVFPVLQVDVARLLDQIEERLRVNLAQRIQWRNYCTINHFLVCCAGHLRLKGNGMI